MIKYHLNQLLTQQELLPAYLSSLLDKKEQFYDYRVNELINWLFSQSEKINEWKSLLATTLATIEEENVYKIISKDIYKIIIANQKKVTTIQREFLRDFFTALKKLQKREGIIMVNLTIIELVYFSAEVDLFIPANPDDKHIVGRHFLKLAIQDLDEKLAFQIRDKFPGLVKTLTETSFINLGFSLDLQLIEILTLALALGAKINLANALNKLNNGYLKLDALKIFLERFNFKFNLSSLNNLCFVKDDCVLYLIEQANEIDLKMKYQAINFSDSVSLLKALIKRVPLAHEEWWHYHICTLLNGTRYKSLSYLIRQGFKIDPCLILLKIKAATEWWHGKEFNFMIRLIRRYNYLSNECLDLLAADVKMWPYISPINGDIKLRFDFERYEETELCRYIPYQLIVRIPPLIQFRFSERKKLIDYLLSEIAGYRFKFFKLSDFYSLKVEFCQ